MNSYVFMNIKVEFVGTLTLQKVVADRRLRVEVPLLALKKCQKRSKQLSTLPLRSKRLLWARNLSLLTLAAADNHRMDRSHKNDIEHSPGIYHHVH